MVQVVVNLLEMTNGARQELSKGQRQRRRKENLEGYVFVAPSVIIIGFFGLFPVLFTIYVSLHKWRIKRGSFRGLANYEEIFGDPVGFLLLVGAVALLVLAYRLVVAGRSGNRGFTVGGILLFSVAIVAAVFALPRVWEAGDSDMFDSLRVTIWYSAGTVPVQLAMGLFLAVLLDARFRGKQTFRVLFLLPYIVPSVASAAVFERLFALRPESFANQVLLLFGGEPLEWLQETDGVFQMLFGWGGTLPGAQVTQSTSQLASYWNAWAQGPSLALVSIMFFNYWVFTGYYALIYANGLAGIPRQLYEAAEVDGAGKPTVFFRVVLPLLAPTTFFLSLLGVIGTFKAFNHIYVLRNAAARGAADPMSIYIFFTFFRKSRFGYSSAMALVLFCIVLGLTLVQRRLMSGKVADAQE
jgi:multiple sugar transport system permease protein